MWLLRGIVILHFVIVVGNFVALILLPFLTPWYVALPLCTFIVRLGVLRDDCPMTNLENKVRENLNMSTIKSFMGHYIVKRFMIIAVMALFFTGCSCGFSIYIKEEPHKPRSEVKLDK